MERGKLINLGACVNSMLESAEALVGILEGIKERGVESMTREDVESLDYEANAVKAWMSDIDAEVE